MIAAMKLFRDGGQRDHFSAMRHRLNFAARKKKDVMYLSSFD